MDPKIFPMKKKKQQKPSSLCTVPLLYYLWQELNALFRIVSQKLAASLLCHTALWTVLSWIRRAVMWGRMWRGSFLLRCPKISTSSGSFASPSTPADQRVRYLLIPQDHTLFPCNLMKDFWDKIEESGKASSHREMNPGQLVSVANVLPLSFDNQTTNHQHPHNPLCVLASFSGFLSSFVTYYKTEVAKQVAWRLMSRWIDWRQIGEQTTIQSG